MTIKQEVETAAQRRKSALEGVPKPSEIADMLRLRKDLDPDAPDPVVIEREVCVEHCNWCNQDYDFFTQSIHCPHAAKPPIWGGGLEPLANIQNAVNEWFVALPLGDITQEMKDDLVKRVYQAVAFQPTGHFGDDVSAYRTLVRKAELSMRKENDESPLAFDKIAQSIAALHTKDMLRSICHEQIVKALRDAKNAGIEIGKREH